MINEIPSTAQQALQAVKLLAQYHGDKLPKVGSSHHLRGTPPAGPGDLGSLREQSGRDVSALATQTLPWSRCSALATGTRPGWRL